jgi:hypothetical protein
MVGEDFALCQVTNRTAQLFSSLRLSFAEEGWPDHPFLEYDSTIAGCEVLGQTIFIHMK